MGRHLNLSDQQIFNLAALHDFEGGDNCKLLAFARAIEFQAQARTARAALQDSKPACGDVAEYTEGICGDGAAILKDGQPMTISEILATLQDSKPAVVPDGYALSINGKIIHDLFGPSERGVYLEMTEQGLDDCKVVPVYAQQPPAASDAVVPNGYALMPVDPTPAMLDVAVSYALNVSVIDEGGWSKYMAAVYRRMLDAAPRPAEEAQ